MRFPGFATACICEHSSVRTAFFGLISALFGLISDAVTKQRRLADFRQGTELKLPSNFPFLLCTSNPSFRTGHILFFPFAVTRHSCKNLMELEKIASNTWLWCKSLFRRLVASWLSMTAKNFCRCLSVIVISRKIHALLFLFCRIWEGPLRFWNSFTPRFEDKFVRARERTFVLKECTYGFSFETLCLSFPWGLVPDVCKLHSSIQGSNESLRSRHFAAYSSRRNQRITSWCSRTRGRNPWWVCRNFWRVA